MEKSTGSAEHRRPSRLLRQLRLEAELTQVEVAKRLHAPQSFVSKYESGDRRLNLIELRHVVDALEVPPGILLERFDPSWLETK